MSAASKDWLVCHLMDISGVMLPRDPYQMGHFEITTVEGHLQTTRSALTTSKERFGISPSPEHRLMKACVLNCTRSEARRASLLHAREALRLFRHVHFFVDHVRLLPAGYVLNIETGAAAPLLPDWEPRSLFGQVAIIDEQAVHPQQILNRIVRAGSGSFGDLGEGIRRSAHWADLASSAHDYGQRFLMQWMAIECLARETDTEVLNAKILTAAGFPRGSYALSLPATERALLDRVPDRAAWEAPTRATRGEATNCAKQHRAQRIPRTRSA